MTEPMIVRVRVAAPKAAVLHALTDPDTLRRWFAEEVAVELPTRYEFWGRYTPEGDAPHQKLTNVDDDGLTFTWLLDGVETTTSITLEAEAPDTTVIVLSQSHFDVQEMFEGKTIRGVLQTFWAMSLANLVDLLEGRELTMRHDFGDTEFRAETLIDATPAEVYDSLIDTDKVSTWFGYPISIEPWVGGRYAMGGFDAPFPPAKILDLEPNQKVTVDWGAPGVQTWELAESDGKTRLTFVQSGFDTTNPPHASWLGSVSGLAELRRFHELTDWKPIWISESV